MQKTSDLDRLIESCEFRFDKLTLKDIDNSFVLKLNRPKTKEEEITLFHRDVSCGDDYFEILHNFIHKSLISGNAAPVVRFADGEYAFYSKDLHCNGLYQQAESVKAIRKAIPLHLKALKILNRSGKYAPLIYPGNIRHKKKTFFSFLHKSRIDDRALKFTEFLSHQSIELTNENYIPFYVVYAYLTSKQFFEILEGKKVCIINSEFNLDLCRKWFASSSSCPDIFFVEIPDAYVATQWESIRKEILDRIPADTDLCIVGAGIGSLLVCVDVANEFSIPAIDAGHVLNMMNGREDKSGEPRLYTIHK